MTHHVYADGNMIAAKSGSGKVIASFPDVCLSPPSPPAGPVPVPYPNTSFSKDLTEGSTSVKLGRKPAALAQQSYYKSSPLGDEAATRTLGMNVIVHTITGKTFFKAWSLDVKIEGKNVCRHIDITTSNHMSDPPGNPTPNPNFEAKIWGAIEDLEDQCACCKARPRHSTGYVMTMDEWYTLDQGGRPTPWASDYMNLVTRVENRKRASPPCTCNERVVPEPPCNVFRRPVTELEHEAIKSRWNGYKDRWQAEQGLTPDMKAIKKKRKTPPYTLSGSENGWLDIEQTLTTPKSKPSTEDLVREKLTRENGRPPTDEEYQSYTQGNHLTPKDAGGCPTGAKNLQSNAKLCAVCKGFEKEFTRMQSDISHGGINR